MKEFPQRSVLHQLQVAVLRFSAEGKSCKAGLMKLAFNLTVEVIWLAVRKADLVK